MRGSAGVVKENMKEREMSNEGGGKEVEERRRWRREDGGKEKVEEGRGWRKGEGEGKEKVME